MLACSIVYILDNISTSSCYCLTLGVFLCLSCFFFGFPYHIIMESADILGSEEDCRSCESGWTMYLVSQSHDHNYNCYYDDDDDNGEEEASDGGESMESDASSGPMELATSSSLKVPQNHEIDEQNSTKMKKSNEDMVLVETTTRVHDDDDDGYDGGNDSYSVVHDYVGSVREEGSV